MSGANPRLFRRNSELVDVLIWVQLESIHLERNQTIRKWYEGRDEYQVRLLLCCIISAEVSDQLTTGGLQKTLTKLYSRFSHIRNLLLGKRAQLIYIRNDFH